jgi:hypothetical protein
MKRNPWLAYWCCCHGMIVSWCRRRPSRHPSAAAACSAMPLDFLKMSSKAIFNVLHHGGRPRCIRLLKTKVRPRRRFVYLIYTKHFFQEPRPIRRNCQET